MSINVKDIPYLPQDSDGPVFCAPWAARAFAMTLRLHQAGHFSWPDWVAIFSAELASNEHGRHAIAGDAEDYFECWVNALETILAKNQIVDSRGLVDSREYAVATWPEPEHVGRREPVARSMPLV